MKGHLIDTDILVDHLRGEEKATKTLHDLYMFGDPVLTSVICEAEIFSNIKAKEKDVVESMFKYIKPLPVDSKIARHAGTFRQIYAKSHQVQIPDALIAATAVDNDLILVTRNKKHYPMREVNVKKPY